MFYNVLTAMLMVCTLTVVSNRANAGLFESLTAQSSGADLPHASEGFKPAREYPCTRSKLIHAVLDAFDENRIPAENIDKQDGRITSGYVQGPTFSTAFGLLGTHSTRYKFTVSLPESGKRMTRLNIMATVESSGDAVQSWRDVSADNRQVVTHLENWLYEQVENRIGIK